MDSSARGIASGEAGAQLTLRMRMLWQFMEIILLLVMSLTTWHQAFLIFAGITGDEFNRGAGYGLEVPCKYRLYGPKLYIQKMQDIVDSLVSSGRL